MFGVNLLERDTQPFSSFEEHLLVGADTVVKNGKHKFADSL
jgi:hypothetical protein